MIINLLSTSGGHDRFSFIHKKIKINRNNITRYYEFVPIINNHVCTGVREIVDNDEMFFKNSQSKDLVKM